MNNLLHDQFVQASTVLFGVGLLATTMVVVGTIRLALVIADQRGRRAKK